MYGSPRSRSRSPPQSPPRSPSLSRQNSSNKGGLGRGGKSSKQSPRPGGVSPSVSPRSLTNLSPVATKFKKDPYAAKKTFSLKDFEAQFGKQGQKPPVKEPPASPNKTRDCSLDSTDSGSSPPSPMNVSNDGNDDLSVASGVFFTHSEDDGSFVSALSGTKS
jgi:hypothetical protein